MNKNFLINYFMEINYSFDMNKDFKLPCLWKFFYAFDQIFKGENFNDVSK
jgi:hypothetical protein